MAPDFDFAQLLLFAVDLEPSVLHSLDDASPCSCSFACPDKVDGQVLKGEEQISNDDKELKGDRQHDQTQQEILGLFLSLVIVLLQESKAKRDEYDESGVCQKVEKELELAFWIPSLPKSHQVHQRRH